jgi:hypothetical protein
MYAAPLALATGLALNNFLQVGLAIVVVLIGLIWWSAHKLTFDCTLIDENQDSSGEGLLEVAGLVKRPSGQSGDPSITPLSAGGLGLSHMLAMLPRYNSSVESGRW